MAIMDIFGQISHTKFFVCLSCYCSYIFFLVGFTPQKSYKKYEKISMAQKQPKMAKKLVILYFFINNEFKKYHKRVGINSGAQRDVEQGHQQVPSKSHEFQVVNFLKNAKFLHKNEIFANILIFLSHGSKILTF